MTFWWRGGHTHTTPTTSSDAGARDAGARFDNPLADNLVGLWDIAHTPANIVDGISGICAPVNTVNTLDRLSGHIKNSPSPALPAAHA